MYKKTLLMCTPPKKERSNKKELMSRQEQTHSRDLEVNFTFSNLNLC